MTNRYTKINIIPFIKSNKTNYNNIYIQIKTFSLKLKNIFKKKISKIQYQLRNESFLKFFEYQNQKYYHFVNSQNYYGQNL